MVREREGDEKRCVQGKYSGKQSYKTEENRHGMERRQKKK